MRTVGGALAGVPSTKAMTDHGNITSHLPPIEVWSDVACPWCYIGKRRLETALAEEGVGEVTVVFRSFQLDPDSPSDFTGDAAAYLSEYKGVPPETARAMQAQVARIAAEEGLSYDFAALRPANTLAAHRLLHLAKQDGIQVDVKERLLRAHFVEGRHVGRDDELADVAAEAGMDRRQVMSMLRSDAFHADVASDISLARRLGIRGVPFFVFGGRLGVSGAQRPETLREALRRAATLPRPEPTEGRPPGVEGAD